jgi:hypothetical protein
MSKFIKKSEVKKHANSKGKWVGESYFSFLDRRIVEIMEADIHALGGRRTLNAGDAESRRELMKRINHA